MKNFINSLQRVTSSGTFIPQVDGLRFVAIASVIIFHIYKFFLERTQNHIMDKNSVAHKIVYEGHYGVEIFFAISGFVLALPFAKHYINNGVKPKLDKYFLRRLTRLEPPYIISLVGMYLFLLVFSGNSIVDLTKSLFASLFYVKNIILHDIEYINLVTWSLEVEIQFYILAPVISLIFILPKIYRRFVLLLICTVFIFLQSIWLPPIFTLYSYIQYFLIGFLLADYYLSKDYYKLKGEVAVILGLISLGLIWSRTILNLPDIFWKLILFCSIYFLFYCTLFTKIWSKIFSIKLLVIIGGMCYSYYLIHAFLIVWPGKVLLDYINTGNLVLDLSIFYAGCIIMILIICTLYFKYIEQPFMKAGISFKKKKPANA